MKRLLTLMVAAFFGCPLFGALTDGLVAHYKFDGNANDSSGNGNNGVVHGATLTTDRFGNANSAYEFDGDDWIQVAHSGSLGGVCGTMTLSGWIRVDEYWDGHWAHIFSKGSDYPRQYGLAALIDEERGNRIYVTDYCMSDSYGIWTPVEDVPSVGVWQHIAATYDGTTCMAYLNGRLVGYKVISFGETSDDDLLIGYDPAGGLEYLVGALDDLRIYNRALSVAEVKALYEGDGVSKTWYVNGASGSDSYSGTSSSQAKKTIQAAIDAAADGDTILVAEGTYAPISAENHIVHIRSLRGASKTFIDGENSWRCIGMYRSGEDLEQEWNEYLDHSGRFDVGRYEREFGSIDGFTIQNGYAYKGGGMRYGVARNCVFRWNDCGWTCGAGMEVGMAINCVFYENQRPAMGWCVSINCTFCDDGVWAGYTYNCILRNTQIHCAYQGEQAGNFSDDPLFVDEQGHDFRLSLNSPCINAGENSYVTSETDLDGKARIVGGKVDIGCYEYQGGQVSSQYTVTFNANGGSCSTSSKQYTSGATLGTLPTATRSGYTFDGWYTSSNGGTKVSSSTVVTGNASYYAHWTVSGGIALGTALNVSGLSFSNGGNASWFGQSVVSHDGASAAQSGKISGSQSSSMQTTVTGPADISFWWKVSSESVSYDYLEFLIDGVQQDKIGGTGGSWSQKTYSVGSGSHTLKWNYRKDGSYDEGEDCGWVDQLVVTPKPTATRSVRASEIRYSNLGNDTYKWPVLIEPNGGEGEPILEFVLKSWSGSYDGVFTVPACPYTRKGYTFSGWRVYDACRAGADTFTYSDGSETCYIGGYAATYLANEQFTICGITALVAQWKAVSAKPVIVCESSYTVTPGKSCSIPIKAESTVKKTTVTVSKLPKGLSFKNGTITGKAAKPGTTKVKVVAKNSKGTTTKFVTIKALNPGFNVTLMARPNGAPASAAQPIEECGDTVQVYVGVQQTIAIASTPGDSGVSSSSAKVTVSGLPKGLTYKSGKISGVVRSTGSKTATVKFKNKWGWSKSFKIVIKAVSMPSSVRGTFNGFVSADASWLYAHQDPFESDGEDDSCEDCGYSNYSGYDEYDAYDDYDSYWTWYDSVLRASMPESYVHGKTYALKMSCGNTGKLSAKLGSTSFTASKWTSAVDGVFKATLTNKGKKLVVIVDANVQWHEASMTVSYSPSSSVYPYPGYAVRNPFGISSSGAYSNAQAGHFVKLLTRSGTTKVATFKTGYGYDLECQACIPVKPGYGFPLKVKVSSTGVATLTGMIGSKKISTSAIIRIAPSGKALATYIVGGMAVDLLFYYNPAEAGHYDEWGDWIAPRAELYSQPCGHATLIK